MDVTATNFEDVLKTLPDVINSAQFLTFDTEFTGLRVAGGTYNYFDTLLELYESARLKATSFIAVQYGICAFKYHPEENKYTCRAYNFYVFPSSKSARNFFCQVSSIRFLAEQGFNFNKVFHDGIPYLNAEELESEHQKLRFRHEKMNQAADVLPMRIPDENKALIDSVMEKLKTFISSDEDELSLPRYNSFLRRLIYQTANSQFGSQITIQHAKDETMRVMKCLSEEEKQKRLDDQREEEEKLILSSVGFSKVIKCIIESGKLLVGHNLLQDLLYTVNQFLQPLPSTFAEFRELVQHLFPKLVDTKYVASAVGCNRDSRESSLMNLLDDFVESEIPVVEAEEPGLGYSRNEERLHEAAYDAYRTGLSFLAMMDRIGKFNATRIFKTLPESILLKEYLNKLSIPRLADIPYMDLEGDYNHPNRNNVFHLTFPETWKRDDILQHFKGFGFLNVAWIDSSSCYIGLGKEYVKKFRKVMLKNQNDLCHIQSYNDFKGNYVGLSDSIKKKKRKSSEDLGDVSTAKVKKDFFSVPDFE